MDDFVYVIAISAIAGASRSSIKAAAYKAAAQGGDLAAVTEAARKAANDSGFTSAVQVVVRLASIAGQSVDGPRKRAVAAAKAAAKAEKARAVESGASYEEARAFAAVKSAEAYASCLPQKMRDILDGRRIPAPIVLTFNGGEVATIDGKITLPTIGVMLERKISAFTGGGLVTTFAASAASIVTSMGHVMPEVLPAKKPEGADKLDTSYDVAWANEPGRVVSGFITGFKPDNGYRIELHTDDLIGRVAEGMNGLADILTAGEIVVPRAAVYEGAVVMTTADDMAAKAKAAKAASIVSIEDAIEAAFALRAGVPKAKAKAKAKPKPRK